MARMGGAVVAAATPLAADGSVDTAKLIAHCGWLLRNGADGINLLGTTGEATSLSVAQRTAVMRAVAGSRLPLARFMVGTGAAALADAATLTRTAMELGFAGALLLPPFYYKNLQDDWVYGYVATVVDTVAMSALRMYLYHYPQLSGVPYNIEVVARLAASYPQNVIGLKDSSGDLGFSRALAKRVAGFDVFPSAEGALGEMQQSGFAGCISATLNVTAPLIAEWRGGADPQALAAAVRMRTRLAEYPLIAAIKTALARVTGDAAWARPLPPLAALPAGDADKLMDKLAGDGFATVRAALAGQAVA
ncbi:MAG: dihydrodipicolinate synthase family protein [Proteobacteria bacterium]|nr:dihydrodipicolinate synthase family protein [Pseudomonadota bacterium]